MLFKKSYTETNLKTNEFNEVNAYLRRESLKESSPNEALDHESSYKGFTNRLDSYYKQIHKTLIAHQSSTTGLFPIYVNKKNQECHVRDSVYCAVAIWSLRQAYSKIDSDYGRTHELGQCAVKCMRGILYCWMRQAHKVEKFKSDQTIENALHQKFNIRNGGDIDDKHYGHLQLDCVCLYLLYLAQMISSGLQIIYSVDEVDFIQNLVFYIERAYRTPDYSIWERGSKYNNNECELHASSIGMAKAALEALNGFDLYGDNGCSWSIIYVDIDAHNRNRTTLETMLPRESSSKNVDASALMVIGFPAFALHDENIITRTTNKCLRRLKGAYGFKRYLRDGANCVLENKRKKFYDASEIKNFDGIESEYPVFYCYMLINCIFSNNLPKAQYYYTELVKLVRDDVLPHYFYVPRECVDAEMRQSGSQVRLPSQEIHLWTQAIWLITQMLVDKVIIAQDLDPLRRYLEPNERPRQSKRYSTFKGCYSDLTINVCCIAESVKLQQLLINYGIQTQTPHQIEPIQIWPPSELVKAYQLLGKNTKLGLSGRPPRPVGCLGTSELYNICSQRIIFYPITFETNEFYMTSDLGLLIDDVKDDLEFLSMSWKLQGRPLYVFVIREQNLRGRQRSEILEFLSQLKQGSINGVPVQMCRLQTALPSACLDHLDFLDEDELQIEFSSIKEIETESVVYQSLTDLTLEVNSSEPFSFKIDDLKHLHVNELISLFHKTQSPLQKAVALHELLNRYGNQLQIDNMNIDDVIANLSEEASVVQNWTVVRYCSSILRKTVDSLAPSITNLLVRGKLVTIGLFGNEEIEINKPLTPYAIKNILYTNIFPNDVYQAVLMQELIINLSKFITTSPDLFNGIIKLRLGWIVDCLRNELNDSRANDLEEQLNIYTLSPNQIKQLLYYILTCNNNPDRCLLRKRQLDGALSRVPNGFYECIWSILKKTPAGIKVNDYFLTQQPTLNDMTDYELNFSIKVEEMLSKIEEPAYRQIVVEMFAILSTILNRNPEYQFTDVIDVEKVRVCFEDSYTYLWEFLCHKIVNKAIELYAKDRGITGDEKIAFYNEKPCIYKGTSAYLARVCIEQLILNQNKASQKSTDCADCKIS